MAEFNPRARRFTIKTSIRYREVGGTSWFEGTTENISRSGVLFRTDHVLELKATVQMSFSVPVQINADGSGEVCCRGSVVRIALSDEPDVTVIAAAIRSYRVVRADRKT